MEEDGANGVRAGPMTPGWSLEAVLPTLTRRCVEYVEARAADEEPFFLFFSMTSPHTPINPDERFAGKSGVNRYADFLLETDWAVGEVLRALEESGLAEDTLVIFTADNGTSPKCDFAALAAGGVDLRGGWRGHKADVWEGGHRVPFLVRWPGVVDAGRVSDELIGLVDVMPTLAAACGIPLPAGAAEDGLSLLPALREPTHGEPLRNSLVNHSSTGRFALRTPGWKLVFAPGSGGWSAPKDGAAREQGLPEVQLYDMQADPGERQNLQAEHLERVAAMTAQLREIVGPGAWWPQLPWPKGE